MLGGQAERVQAEVIARWEDRCVMLRVRGGGTLQMPTSESIADRWDVGAPVWIELDADGAPARWGLRED